MMLLQINQASMKNGIGMSTEMGRQECLKCGSCKELIKHVHLERTLQIPTNTTLFPRNSKKVSNTNACEELLDDSAFQQPYMYMCAFTGETQSVLMSFKVKDKKLIGIRYRNSSLAEATLTKPTSRCTESTTTVMLQCTNMNKMYVNILSTW